MRKLKLTVLAVIALTAFVSCKNDTEEEAQSLDGFWESVGYGRFVKIEGENFETFQITSKSCLPELSGELDMFGDKMYLKNDTLRLDDGINHYMFVRSSEQPASCVNQDTSFYALPIANFEVVAETFRDHYAYFEERNINWDSTYGEYRPQVTMATSPWELYNILEDMFDSFNDGHIGLSASDEIEQKAAELKAKLQEEAIEPEPEFKPISGFVVRDSIANHYVDDLKKRVYGFLQWGKITPDVGYVQLNQMFGFADYGIDESLDIQEYFGAYFEQADQDLNHSDKQVRGIRKHFNEVLDDFADVEAIIIDVRFNGGGSDEVGMEVLSFFNPEKKEVFSKQAWYKGQLTPKNRVYLHAGSRQSDKKIYLLISPESASATEIMTLTSLEIPQVTRIGSETEGVFSDVFDRQLPNGMDFGLSNEVYLSMDGTNYEGKGIPADVPMNYSRERYEFFWGLLDDLGGEGDRAIDYVLIKHQ